jgi:hypothetical protein
MKKEIISTFKEKPKTKTAWRAMYLGLSVFLAPFFLGIFAAVIRPMIDKISSENIGAAIGFSFGAIVLIFSILALVTSIRAYRKGERSWVLWVGFIPAILIGIFWIFMIVGEFLFPH